MEPQAFTKVRIRYQYINKKSKFKSEQGVLVYLGKTPENKLMLGWQQKVDEVTGVVYYPLKQTAPYQIPAKRIVYLRPVPEHLPIEKFWKVKNDLPLPTPEEELIEWLGNDLVRVTLEPGNKTFLHVMGDELQLEEWQTIAEIEVMKHDLAPMDETHKNPAGFEARRRAAAHAAASAAGIRLFFRIDMVPLAERTLLMQPLVEPNTVCVDCQGTIKHEEIMVYEPCPEVHDTFVAPAHPQCAVRQGFKVVAQ